MSTLITSENFVMALNYATSEYITHKIHTVNSRYIYPNNFHFVSHESLLK